MRTPTFFDDVPRVLVVDPLAELLGAIEDGAYELRYPDAVRLAGHSCPTVASAWLLGIEAWRKLFAPAPLVRGSLRVTVAGELGVGTAGVVGAVLQLMTGAAGAAGFRGIAGHYARADLLTYAPMDGSARFVRVDNGHGVEVTVRPEVVPPIPGGAPPDLRRVLAGTASADEARVFRDAWQERVRRMLIETSSYPRLIASAPFTADASAVAPAGGIPTRHF